MSLIKVLFFVLIIYIVSLDAAEEDVNAPESELQPTSERESDLGPGSEREPTSEEKGHSEPGSNPGSESELLTEAGAESTPEPESTAASQEEEENSHCEYFDWPDDMTSFNLIVNNLYHWLTKNVCNPGQSSGKDDE